MKLSRSALILASLGAASAALGAACSFPQIGFSSESASTTASSNVNGTSTATAGGGGATGASSATAGGGGGDGSASSSASSSSGGTCSIDEDHDGAISTQCPGGTDCADHDFNAHPEPQVNFQGGMIQGTRAPGTQPFDFNCDGSELGETLVLNCAGLANCSSGLGFEKAVACGQSGALGHCVSIATLGCHWEPESPPQSKVQKCK